MSPLTGTDETGARGTDHPLCAPYAVVAIMTLDCAIRHGVDSRTSVYDEQGVPARKKGNHNHRPCRWYAQAPLGPFTGRAYRLIEFSFARVFCPTTADAAMDAPKAPLCKG